MPIYGRIMVKYFDISGGKKLLKTMFDPFPFIFVILELKFS